MLACLLHDELISCEQINREQISHEHFCFPLRGAGLGHGVQTHAHFARDVNELVLPLSDCDAEIFDCAIRRLDALRGLESRPFVPQQQLADHHKGHDVRDGLLVEAPLLNDEPASLISECAFDFSGVQHAFLSPQSQELRIKTQQVRQHSLVRF